MIPLKKIMLLWLLACFSWQLVAQETTVFTEANQHFKKGKEHFEVGLYGKAQSEFKKTVHLLQPVNEAESDLLKMQAELHYAKSAVRLNLPDGEKLMLDFIRNYSPDPISNQALIELANYYYDQKDYEKAIEYFSSIPSYNLTKDQRSEVKFKMGYALFVKKKFPQAKAAFEPIRDIQNEYFYPTNYYLGLCYFFESNYDKALRQFKLVERSKKFGSHIPYYQAQILFAEARYDELIQYAEPKLNQGGLRKTKEIHQLVGQAYFEKGQYAKALPHLEFYAERSGKLREEEFYQLGFAQYQMGNYQKAIRNFEQLIGVESPLAQSALYTLGDLYLKSNDKNSARNVFGQAAKMTHDLGIQEEALFNFAKLSYELKFDRDALTALQSIRPGTKYYTDAQTLMSELFLNTRDYERAMEVIEKMPNKTPSIREAYQKVVYMLGLQRYKEGKLQEAEALFQKSQQTPIDPTTNALASYWLGEMAYDQKDYDKSIRLTNQFLTLAQGLNNLPDDASIHTANYRQAYSYLKQKNYVTAQNYFGDAINGIKRNQTFIQNDYIKNQVLGDAVLRAGDCSFKRNQYNDAIGYYNEAINRRYAGFVYALYQKAIIEGLRGNTADKLVALEEIARSYPRSEFADDALFQAGITYQEIGQLNQAVQPFQQLVQNHKTSPLINQSLIRLGLISYNQGNLETAINYYKRIFQNNPEPAEAQSALTALEEIYINDLGEPDKYFAFLETIPGYKVEGTSKDSINFRAAEAQFENGNYERAITAYSDYLRKFPNGRHRLLAYFRRGDSYTVLKNYSKALPDYEYVVSRGPSKYYVKALEKAAIIAYNHEQNFNKSFDLYAKLESAATNEDMRFEAQLGGLRSAYRINNRQAVYNLAGKVTNSASASQQQKATANFYLGKIAFDQNDLDNALAAFNKVVQLSDNEQTAEARYLIALIYYQRGNYDTAQQLCINANQESSNYPYWVAKTIILLSDVLKAKGDLYNARAALEALLENYKGDAQLIAEAQQKLQVINNQINASSRLSAPSDADSVIEFEDDGSN